MGWRLELFVAGNVWHFCCGFSRIRCLSQFLCVLLADPLLSLSFNFLQLIFVSLLFSQITYKLPPASLSFCLSLCLYLSLSLSLSVSLSLTLRPASHRNVSRGTPGETNWIKRVQSSAGARLSVALSQLPSLRPLRSPSCSSVSRSMFSLFLTPPSGLPLSSFLSCKPFRCSFLLFTLSFFSF